MFTSDEQILKLPAILINDGKISGTAQFFEETGITKKRFSQVENQDKYDRAYHFTPEQIECIANKYDINYNWIFASSNEVYNKKIKINQNTFSKESVKNQ